MKEFYDQNVHDRFTDVEEVHARHILVRVDPAAKEEAKQQARAEADDILKQIRTGGDFEALAKKRSKDPGSAPKGGDLGFFPRGRMVPAFDAAVFALKPHEVSEVVETPFGFHIIRLEEHKPGGPRPFEAVREQIEKELTAERSLDLARKQADSDRRTVVRGKPLQEAVGDRKVEETPPFAAGADIPQVGRVKAFSDEAFNLDENQVSNLIETDDAIYMLVPFDRKEPIVPPLAEIREAVEADAKRAAGERLAKAEAEKLLTLAKEVGLEKAAAEKSAKLDETGTFDRRAGVVPKIGAAAELRTDAFNLTTEAPLGQRVYVAGDDAVVVALKARTPADMKDLATAESGIRDSLLSQRRQAALSSFMSHLKERAAREGALRVQRRHRSRLSPTGSSWPGTRRSGCVLVHGFTATPDEVRPLGDALAAAGFPCHAVCLPGHATTVADLALVRHQQWLATVERAVRTMAADVPHVALAGVSLGALLALAIAAAGVPPVHALVLLGTPLRFADERTALLRFVAWVPGRHRAHAARREAPRARHPRRGGPGALPGVRRDAALGRRRAAPAARDGEARAPSGYPPDARAARPAGPDGTGRQRRRVATALARAAARDRRVRAQRARAHRRRRARCRRGARRGLPVTLRARLVVGAVVAAARLGINVTTPWRKRKRWKLD